MSILIKGMEMPKNCGVCELCGCYTESKGEVHRCDISMYVIKNLERRLDNCPLVEVPTPHGRLIDADEEIMVQTYDDQYEEWRQTKMTIDDLLCVGWVEAEAPTVIPASEVET